jgi:hypothetical protein
VSGSGNDMVNEIVNGFINQAFQVNTDFLRDFYEELLDIGICYVKYSLSNEGELVRKIVRLSDWEKELKAVEKEGFLSLEESKKVLDNLGD